ncbi:MAG: septum formation protein Maf [Lachnospiraceae bacterium]|nr:septum formation protein Maf [Lachnospiraceae bacterium]
MKIILASASPRRRELMELAGIPFETDVSEADENMDRALSPADYVEELSRRKAGAVAARHRGDMVIGADTIVALEDKILGKPKDETEAYEMLCTLAGRTHSVYTGVTISYGTEETFHVKTDVTMYLPDEGLLRAYSRCGEPLDKAGAYGIQGKGALLVKRIEGDYYNVMGLPIAELYRRLRDMSVLQSLL